MNFHQLLIVFIFCSLQLTQSSQSSPTVFWIDENLPKDSLIGKLILTSTSSSGRSISFISLAKPPISDFFRVTPDQGQIYANRLIDREALCASRSRRSIDQGHTFPYSPLPTSTCEVNFQVHVSTSDLDDSSSIDNSLLSVRIVVADVNDNDPFFYSQASAPFELELPESSPIDSEFRLPQALDLDSGPNDVASYRLVKVELASRKTVGRHDTSLVYCNEDASSSPKLPVNFSALNEYNLDRISTYFQLINRPIEKGSPSVLPILHQLNSLNREEIEAFYFCLQAVDGGGRQGNLLVVVRMLDVNDNYPQWLGLPYKTKVSECWNKPGHGRAGSNQLLLGQLQADDSDTGVNAELTYRLGRTNHASYQKGHPLQVNSPSGLVIQGNKLLLKADVDYEQLGKFNVPVEVVDGGGLINRTDVEVEIVDCNDHPPEIWIIPLTKGLDQDTVADDRSSTHSIDLWVQEEQVNSSLDLATVMLSDPDRGQSTKLTCQLTGKDLDLGKLQLRESDISDQSSNDQTIYTLYKPIGVRLDREQSSVLVFILMCSDNGSPILQQSEKTIHLHLLDVNDNQPRFGQRNDQRLDETSKQTMFIEENKSIGSLVGYVQAYDLDADDNGRITFQLMKPSMDRESGWHLFEVNSSTGVIYTRMPLDRELNSSYLIEVKATDHGEPPLDTTVEVEIIVGDVNDSPPIIITTPGLDDRVVFKLVESDGLRPINGRFVGQFRAIDPDQGPNGSVSFSLVPDTLVVGGAVNYDQSSMEGQAQLSYRINPSGHVYADGLIDREQASHHEFVVRAIDNGPVGHRLTTTATAIVYLIDINDCSPRFVDEYSGRSTSSHLLPASTYTQQINLTYSTPPGSIVHRLKVTDPDSSTVNKISFDFRSTKLITDYFSLRQSEPISLGSNDYTEVNADLILVNSLTYLESDVGHRSPSDSQPQSFFVYIVVKDSDQDPIHTATARLHLNIYPKLDYHPMSLKGRHNQSMDKNLPDSKQWKMADDDEGLWKSTSTTALLIMATIIVCIFLAIFLFVAIVYIRGYRRRRSGQVRRQHSRSSEKSLACCKPRLIEQPIDDSVDAYWELTGRGFDLGGDKLVTHSSLNSSPIDKDQSVGGYTLGTTSSSDHQLSKPVCSTILTNDNRLRITMPSSTLPINRHTYNLGSNNQGSVTTRFLCDTLPSMPEYKGGDLIGSAGAGQANYSQTYLTVTSPTFFTSPNCPRIQSDNYQQLLLSSTSEYPVRQPSPQHRLVTFSDQSHQPDNGDPNLRHRDYTCPHHSLLANTQGSYAKLTRSDVNQSELIKLGDNNAMPTFGTTSSKSGDRLEEEAPTGVEWKPMPKSDSKS